MTDLNTYLNSIKTKLLELEVKYAHLEESETAMKNQHLQEIENILKEVRLAYSKLEIDKNPNYPLQIDNLSVEDEDIVKALNKLFKLG